MQNLKQQLEEANRKIAEMTVAALIKKQQSEEAAAPIKRPAQLHQSENANPFAGTWVDMDVPPQEHTI